MTGPSYDIQRHADTLQERLARLTDTTTVQVTADLAARIVRLRRELVALYVREFGGVDRMPETWGDASRFSLAAQALVTSALQDAAPDTGPIIDALTKAYALGTDHALDTVPVLPLSLPERPAGPAPDLSRTLADQLAQTLSALSESAVRGTGFQAVGVAGVKAHRSVSRVGQVIAWEVTRNATDGVRAVAQQAGAHVLWVAERSGCLHCLAYAGQTTTASGLFPPGLTFDVHPLIPPGPLTGPPLHPHCRCTLEVFDQRDEAVVDALKREAKRSVLRGESVDGDAAKLRAADRLLLAGSGLPKTVEERARRAVRRGQFNARDRETR